MSVHVPTCIVMCDMCVSLRVSRRLSRLEVMVRGRGNSREIDLNRNFPDLNALMYYYEKTNGRNHHLPLPDNWEQQVSATGGPIYLYV